MYLYTVTEKNGRMNATQIPSASMLIVQTDHSTRSYLSHLATSPAILSLLSGGGAQCIQRSSYLSSCISCYPYSSLPPSAPSFSCPHLQPLPFLGTHRWSKRINPFFSPAVQYYVGVQFVKVRRHLPTPWRRGTVYSLNESYE